MSDPSPGHRGRRVLLRLDADHHIGQGHAVRMRALLGELEDVEVEGCGAGSSLAALLPGVVGWIAPDDGVARLSSPPDVDALLVDHPAPEIALLEAARSHFVPVIRIDDFGFRGDASLVINGSPGASPALYPDVPRERVRAGLDHALLRRPFRAARNARREHGPVPGHVVCVVGSGEGALPFARSVAAARPKLGAALELVVGASFPRDARLEARAAENDVPIHRGLDAETLAARLAAGSLALTTGGMVVSECLAVGIPILAHAQVPCVSGELAWLRAEGALAVLDPRDALDPDRLAVRIDEAMRDPERDDRARRGLDLVDGLGAQRAARAIVATAWPSKPAPEVATCASP